MAAQLVSKTFLMLCEHIKRDKLEPLWDCLIAHISAELSGDASTSLPRPHPEVMIHDSAEAEPQENGHSLSPGLKGGEDTVHSMQDKCLSDSSGPGPPVKMAEENPLHLTEPPAEKHQMHLVHLLSLLTDVLEFRKGSRVNGEVSQ